MAIEFNTAKPQQEMGDLIPAKTIAPVRLAMRGETSTKAGDARMLDCEFVVLEGPYSKRRFWGMMMITSNGSDGHNKAVEITRSRVRAMIESAYGIDPSDDSPAAMEGRTIQDWADLDGLEFVAKIGVEKDKTGQYGDKNVLNGAVTPDSKEYAGFVPKRPSNAGMVSNQAAATTSAGDGKWK